MTVTVVGCGYVGLASAVWLARNGHVVTAVEVDPLRFAALSDGLMPFQETGLEGALGPLRAAGTLRFAPFIEPAQAVEVVVVAVPTSDDPADDRVSRVFADAMRLCPEAIVLIKSTLAPHHVQTLAALAGSRPWAVNPEFLREGTALLDVTHPSRVVLGGDAPAVETARRLYQAHGDGIPVVVTDAMGAVLGKLAANAMLAVRVAFASELSLLAGVLGCGYDGVLEVMATDPRIGRAHLLPSLGFGGPCLPKDARMLAQVPGSMHLAEAALAVNERVQEAVLTHLEEAIGTLSGKQVAVWGQAFKPGTADTRESRALSLTEALRARGARVQTHDPSVDAGQPPDNADAIVIATAWPGYRTVDPHALVMRSRHVLDPCRLLDAVSWMDAGFTVWPSVTRPHG